MKKISVIVLLIFFTLLFVKESNAQFKPRGGNFGFGIVLGDPTGATLKLWTNSENALVFGIGGSYFGSPRIGVDYLWHFDAFNSRIVNLYAGPGGALGLGRGSGFWYKEGKDKFYYRDNDGIGLAARGIFGLNVVPERTPLEIFFEFGALLGLAPDFGSALDVALGIRFYP